jgi:hypothetical protein
MARKSTSPESTPTRLYVVWETPATGDDGTTAEDKPVAVVDTTSAAAALRHFVKPRFSVRVASPRDMINVHAAGIKIETPSAEDAADE